MADDHMKMGFQGSDLYLIQSTPQAPPEEIAKHMQAHLARQVQLEKDGILFSAGPVFEEGGERPAFGMIVIRAKSFDEAREIADGDPMHASGARRYTLHRWKINEGSFNIHISYSDLASAVS